MRNRVFWLVASCLVALSMIVASCAPPAPTTPTPAAPTPTTPTPTTPTPTAPAGPEMVSVTFTKLDGSKVEKLVEKPKYGGTINVINDRESASWDPTIQRTLNWGTYGYTNDILIAEDFYRGMGGSEENDWLTNNPLSTFTSGDIATSYELSGGDTITYFIRKGVRFHNIPPLNGREVTADDVVFCIKRSYDMLPDYPNPKAQNVVTTTPEQRPISVTAADKYTVVLKVNPAGMGEVINAVNQDAIYAKEIVPKAGETWDWKRNIGNGAWILKDFVPNTSYSYVRNPDYWRTDQAFPENQLPYLDGFKQLVIADTSTRMAALRTGKIDMMPEISLTDVDTLLPTAPGLEVIYYVGSAYHLSYRIDKPELPWSNLKVRQAMQMAIDREAIKRDLYKGRAEIYSYPTMNELGMKTMGYFYPFEELPANVQELFTYNPDKAKQMLAEAGYPNGFTMEVITVESAVDALSVVQFYLEKVGVKLVIDVKERGVYSSIASSKTHKEGAFNLHTSNRPWNWAHFKIGNVQNMSMIDDPFINAKEKEYFTAFMLDDDKAAAIYKSLVPYALEQAWKIALPAPFVSTVWWPWLKNYHGEWMGSAGYRWVPYVWYDQVLKKQMGY